MIKRKLYDPDRLDFVITHNNQFSGSTVTSSTGDIADPASNPQKDYMVEDGLLTIQFYSKIYATSNNTTDSLASIQFSFLNPDRGEGAGRLSFQKQVADNLRYVFGDQGETEATALDETSRLALSTLGMMNYDNTASKIEWSVNGNGLKLSSVANTDTYAVDVTRPTSTDGAPVKVTVTAKTSWKKDSTSTVNLVETKDLWIQTQADPTAPRIRSIDPSSGTATIVFQPQDIALATGNGVTKVDWYLADVSEGSTFKESDLTAANTTLWNSNGSFDKDKDAIYQGLPLTKTITSGNSTKSVNCKYRAYVRFHYDKKQTTTSNGQTVTSVVDTVTKLMHSEDVVLSATGMTTPKVLGITVNSITLEPVSPVNAGTFTERLTQYQVTTATTPSSTTIAAGYDPKKAVTNATDWHTVTAGSNLTIDGLNANTKYYIYARSIGYDGKNWSLIADTTTSAVGPYTTLTAVPVTAANAAFTMKNNDLFGSYDVSNSGNFIISLGIPSFKSLSSDEITSALSSGKIAAKAAPSSGHYASIYIKMPTDYENNISAYKYGYVDVDGNKTKLDGNVVVLGDNQKYIQVVVYTDDSYVKNMIGTQQMKAKQFTIDWDGTDKNVLSPTTYTVQWMEYVS